MTPGREEAPVNACGGSQLAGERSFQQRLLGDGSQRRYRQLCKLCNNERAGVRDAGREPAGWPCRPQSSEGSLPVREAEWRSVGTESSSLPQHDQAQQRSSRKHLSASA